MKKMKIGEKRNKKGSGFLMRRNGSKLSTEEAYEIINENRYAVVSLIDAEGLPYGVALDYIYKENSLYFHGAQEGRKIEAMKINPNACAVILGETIAIPDKFGREYVSVVVEGQIKLINDAEIKRQVMRWVVEINSPDYLEKGYAVIEKMLDRVLVYKMDIVNISGKHGIK